jgi:hypothetical protein
MRCAAPGSVAAKEFSPMRFSQVLRPGGWVILAGWAVGSTGCIHNHYYGTMPAYTNPADGTVTSQFGAVCEVPPPGSRGTIISQTPGRTTVLAAPLVVNSQPMGARPFQRGASRFPWRRQDDDAVMARTEVEGDLETQTR